jgi:hypothetical protein
LGVAKKADTLLPNFFIKPLQSFQSFGKAKGIRLVAFESLKLEFAAGIESDLVSIINVRCGPKKAVVVVLCVVHTPKIGAFILSPNIPATFISIPAKVRGR